MSNACTNSHNFRVNSQNILEKFNPSAKQLIGSSKSYLKSLHSTSAASKVFIESLAKLAVNAQHGGGTDIGKQALKYLSS